MRGDSKAMAMFAGSTSGVGPVRILPVAALLSLLIALTVGVSLALAAAQPPSVDQTFATNVTDASAALGAQINPNTKDTHYAFEYISESAYQANLGEAKDPFSGATRVPAQEGEDADIGAGSTDQAASAQIFGLAASTTYRYRAIAYNSRGLTEGFAHAITTQESSPSTVLPDSRGYEMVSPVEKNGGSVSTRIAGGELSQASTDGHSVTYNAITPFAGAKAGTVGSQYLGRRGSDSWMTEALNLPEFSGTTGAVGTGVPYQLFSPDLSLALIHYEQLHRGNPPLPGTDAPDGVPNLYIRDNTTGAYQALITNANSTLRRLPDVNPIAEVESRGATPDLSHVALWSCLALTPDAVETTGCGSPGSLYEWSEGRLDLISLLPDGSQAKSTPDLAADNQTISADGSRALWTEGESGPLYLRKGIGTPQAMTEPLPGASGKGFVTANSDLSKLFYLGGGELSEFDVETSQLHPLANEVLGVLGATEDGSYIYAVSTNALPPGGVKGARNLYLLHGGAATFIASLASADDVSSPAKNTARITPDGLHLAFMSSSNLTGYDNTVAAGSSCGLAPDETPLPPACQEAYVYDAQTEQLSCASCNPTGARPLGPSGIPGVEANGIGQVTESYKPRALSADGKRLFFNSSDALVPNDSNDRQDVYEWEAQGSGTCQKAGGCISLISSGTSPEDSSFIDAGTTGSDAFFLTASSLAPQDPGSADLYDAREGGGFPLPVPPPACEGDACQSPAQAPGDPTLSSSVSSGPGNPSGGFRKPRHRKPHQKHRHRKRAAQHNRGGAK